ncbi:hypothetical protein GWQ43_05610 [Alcaligenes faecalis]|uniref:hypothetical protein n=1 Tax=Alcaligenes faecalis TaxID=511 RepID=UPI00137C1AEB|nr:hypothetical protein [Alcaligenes faecalis]QHS35584.1 hypothetical protein GWQ43_05610 [Alcaligenes faecalis]
MPLLFIVCLFLAWPTSGLSFVAYLVILFGRAYLRGKAGKTRDAYLTAQRNADSAIQQNRHQAPSWIHNPALQKQLVIETRKAATEAGMTKDQADAWFSDEQTASAIMTAAAQFEQQGMNRFEQIVGASDFTARLAREHIQAADHQAEVPEATEAEVSVREPQQDMGDYEEGKRHFSLGMQCAFQYKTSEAIQHYSRSIILYANPAPYINRANLLGKRIRHYEALQDLLAAQVLDVGQEFGREIANELAITQRLTSGYRNGLREQLLEEHSRSDDPSTIAARLFCESFNINPGRWRYNTFDNPFVEYHLFNELDNIVKFEDVKNYPEAEELVEAYPAAFIQHKVKACPDINAYAEIEAQLHSVLCLYEEKDMRYLRRSIIYEIHSKLLARDFGDMYMAFSSDCEGIIKEAMEFTEHGESLNSANKEVSPPSNIKTLRELNAEILLMMQSGSIFFVSDALAARSKDWLGGAVMEIMIESPGHAPFFVYYENNAYYAKMATNGGKLNLADASQLGDFEQYRTDVSMAVCASLVSLVYQKSGKDIRHPQMQFSHNHINTNVIAYVEKLQQWYPIQHGSEEDEDATDRKVALVNSGRAPITDFVAIAGPSPR